jgi:hypothetical protein
MKRVTGTILVSLLLFTTGNSLAQKRGQDAEYDAFVHWWYSKTAYWMRFNPNELREAEPVLQKLRQRYPNNEWLKHAELRLLAQRQDWQGVRALLDTPPRPKGTWSDRWRIHVYWQEGDYRSVLWSDASRRYFRFRLWCLVLPVAIFLYGWRLSRQTGSSAILAAVTLPLVVSVLALPYHWVASIIVSGAPYPIAYVQEHLSDIIYNLLLFGTLSAGVVLLLRKRWCNVHFTPVKLNWLTAGAVILLVSHGGWTVSQPLWANPHALSTLIREAGSLSRLAVTEVMIDLLLRDVSLALLMVSLAYRGARSSLPPVPAFAFALLVSFSTPNSWWEPEQGLAMLRFSAFWVIPALMLYERFGRFGIALMAFWWSTVMTNLGSVLSTAQALQ